MRENMVVADNNETSAYFTALATQYRSVYLWNVSDNNLKLIAGKEDSTCINYEVLLQQLGTQNSASYEIETESFGWLNITALCTKRDANAKVATCLITVSDINAAKQKEKHNQEVLDDERSLYRNALLHEANYSYLVDLTDNIIRKPLFSEDPLVDYHSLEFPFPMNYDQYLNEWNSKYKMDHTSPENADELITCAGLLGAYAENKRQIEFEYTIHILKSYRKKTVLLSKSSETGHIMASVIIKDVSEERKQEMKYQHKLLIAKQEAEAANDAKSEFLSRMSHDMRTPLNVILGITHLSLERKHAAKTMDELKKINTSSKFLLGIINDVLDMTKAESGKIELYPEPYTSDEMVMYVDAIIRPLCDEKGIKFHFYATSGIEYVPLVDKLRLNQILFNLLSNSVKFTAEGGSVTIGLQEEVTKEKKVAVKIVESDTGIGMSEDFQKVMFDSFTQEHRNDVSENRGTGLGLCIVKKLVDLMNGSIKVKSALGQGTTFTLDLEFDSIPCTALKVKQDKVLLEDDSILQGKHVLLCEDHPLNQEIAIALLEEKKMIVDIADNGQVGVQKFSHSTPGFYDVILMDIRMPILDGYEATAAIRELSRPDAKTVPIIAMTADAFADDVKKCLNSGMNGHVPKPIETHQLFKELIEKISKE